MMMNFYDEVPFLFHLHRLDWHLFGGQPDPNLSTAENVWSPQEPEPPAPVVTDSQSSCMDLLRHVAHHHVSHAQGAAGVLGAAIKGENLEVSIP